MLGDMSITSFCDFFSLFPLSIISPTPIIYNLGCQLSCCNKSGLFNCLAILSFWQKSRAALYCPSPN